MIGGHDLGGKPGMGPINPEPESEEPVFHDEWERRVFALTLATGMLGQWNIDESRFARERQEPSDYLKNSYYENWLEGITKLLVEKNLVSQAELDSGHVSATESGASLRIPTPEDVEKIMSSGGPTLMASQAPPQFQLGDRVRVRACAGKGHTRAPGYAQGAAGTILGHYGTHVFPDANSKGERIGKHLYSVSFQAQALWSSGSEEGTEVLIDLWEPYLEMAND